jgi:hypothetical protein
MDARSLCLRLVRLVSPPALCTRIPPGAYLAGSRPAASRRVSRSPCLRYLMVRLEGSWSGAGAGRASLCGLVCVVVAVVRLAGGQIAVVKQQSWAVSSFGRLVVVLL